MEQLRAEGVRRHEEELARTEQLAAQARAGSASERKPIEQNGQPAVGPGQHLVEFDWRGETATYFEQVRLVTLSCAYWGGPTGTVTHLFGVWEYPDGRREPLTDPERAEVLHAVVERAASVHGITLEVRDA